MFHCINFQTDYSDGGGVDDEVAKQQQQQRRPAWASVCKSACSSRENPCSAEAVAVGKWSVGQVCDFVSDIDACKPFVEVRTTMHGI